MPRIAYRVMTFFLLERGSGRLVGLWGALPGALDFPTGPLAHAVLPTG